MENAIENKSENQTEIIENFDADFNQLIEYEENETTIFEGIIAEDGSSIKALIEEMKSRQRHKAVSSVMNRKFRKRT